jgi:chemotaxis protein histidine kinase CheA
VQPDHFSDRLDVVRRRFAASLEGKIIEIYAELPILSSGDTSAVDAVANVYRRVHGMCGVGAAVGFADTGRAAKRVEDVLISAYRAQRGLAAAEMEHLKTELAVLASAAQVELHTTSESSDSTNKG